MIAVLRPADLVDMFEIVGEFSGTPLKNEFSLSKPTRPPSAEAPLSPTS